MVQFLDLSFKLSDRFLKIKKRIHSRYSTIYLFAVHQKNCAYLNFLIICPSVKGGDLGSAVADDFVKHEYKFVCSKCQHVLTWIGRFADRPHYPIGGSQRHASICEGRLFESQLQSVEQVLLAIGPLDAESTGR